MEEENQHDREEDVPKMEERVWEELKPVAFKTQPVSFVVCLNTMGQDREFTEEEQKVALRTVRTFKEQWEQIETNNLQSDVDRRIYNISNDKIYKTNNEEMDLHAMERKVEDSIVLKEGDEPLDEDAKLLLRKKAQLMLYERAFYVSPELKEKLKPKSTRTSKQ